MKVVPTCDPQKGRGRISVGTKYMLGLCGYAIGLGVALELASDMKALIGSGCSGNMTAAINAMKAALLAIAAKFPELVMYYMLFLVYCAEFAYNFWTACCGVCCGRGLDNSDKDKRPNINSPSSSAEFPDGKHCCQGVCDTREDPPKGRGCNQPWIETFFYKFYCWFFFAIEDIFGAFYLWEPKACCFFFGPTVSKVMRMCPCLKWFPDIYIPYWPNLNAFKKDYEKFEFQWKLDEDTPHGRVMNRE